MDKIELNVPLDRRAVDAAQETIALMSAERSSRTELRTVAKSLFAQSERIAHNHPRDASTLYDLGRLASDSADDLDRDRV